MRKRSDLTRGERPKRSVCLRVQAWPRKRPRLRRRLRDRGDVCRLRTLRALAGLELDASALGQALEALTGDVAVVNEEILRALVGRAEAVPLRSEERRG